MTNKASKPVIYHYKGNRKVIDNRLSGSVRDEILSSIAVVPDEFVLNNTYLNHFNPVMKLKLGLQANGNVSIEIYYL